MRGKAWTPDHQQTLEIMVGMGCDNHLIAAHTGHSIATIQRHRSAAGLPPYYEVRRGTWNEPGVLTLKASARATDSVALRA